VITKLEAKKFGSTVVVVVPTFLFPERSFICFER